MPSFVPSKLQYSYNHIIYIIVCIEIYRKRAGAKSCLMIEMCLLTISKKYNLKYYKKKKKKRNGKKNSSRSGHSNGLIGSGFNRRPWMIEHEISNRSLNWERKKKHTTYTLYLYTSAENRASGHQCLWFNKCFSIFISTRAAGVFCLIVDEYC